MHIGRLLHNKFWPSSLFPVLFWCSCCFCKIFERLWPLLFSLSWLSFLVLLWINFYIKFLLTNSCCYSGVLFTPSFSSSTFLRNLYTLDSLDIREYASSTATEWARLLLDQLLSTCHFSQSLNYSLQQSSWSFVSNINHRGYLSSFLCLSLALPIHILNLLPINLFIPTNISIYLLTLDIRVRYVYGGSSCYFVVTHYSSFALFYFAFSCSVYNKKHVLLCRLFLFMRVCVEVLTIVLPLLTALTHFDLHCANCFRSQDETLCSKSLTRTASHFNRYLSEFRGIFDVLLLRPYTHDTKPAGKTKECKINEKIILPLYEIY